MYYCNLLLALGGKSTHKYSALVKNTKAIQNTKILFLNSQSKNG